MKKIVGCMLIAFSLLIGCKSDSNPVADVPAPAKTAAWIGIVFPNPIKNTTDANAVKTAGLIALMDTQATAPWLRPFDTVAAVSFKNINQWTLVAGTLTEVLTKTSVGDSVFGCTLKYSGTLSGTTYSNTLAYSDSNRADGKFGYWALYYLPLSPLVKNQEFQYAVDARGTSTGKNVLFPGGPQTVIADSANGNGVITRSTLVAGSFFVVTYKAQWLSDGSGQWTSYDITGTLTGTGIWGK